MEIETSYKFNGDDKVSDVAEFLRERHVHVGWSMDNVEPDAFGAYSARGAIRLDFTEEFDPEDDDDE